MSLLRTARAHRERDFLMLLVTYTHGLRVSETLALTTSSIKDGYLIVQRLKGSKRTKQRLQRNADPLLDERPAVEAYVRNQRPNQKLFPLSRRHADRLIKRYGAIAGIPEPKLHMHAMKHTIAMHTIKIAGIENTRQWLGHQSMSSTGEYLKVSDEDAGLAIEKALNSDPKSGNQ